MRNPPADLLVGLSRGLGSDKYLYLPERQRTQAAIAEFLQRRKSLMPL
jgi:hypothetical protein